MPSKSKRQQRLFGQAWAIRIGELDRDSAWKQAIKIADSDMTDAQIKDFAKTKHQDLPELIKKESIIMTFESFCLKLKNLDNT